MRQILLFLCLIFIVIWSCSKGPEDPETRADRLGSQLRCPVCRGVPISESPSTLAIEMMTLVRTQVQEGKSDEEILKYFETRYGEWVLLEPKPEGMNLMVWILPILVFLGGGAFIFVVAKRRKSS